MATRQGTDQQATGHSPANVMKYLKGIHFPAQKADVVDRARENGAPQEAMGFLEKLPEQGFGGPQEVLKTFGEGE